jgi:hypothetical protein
MATMDVGAVPCVCFCDGCSVCGQCRIVKVSIIPDVYRSCLCQICQDYVSEGLKDGDQELVLCILTGRMPPGWHWRFFDLAEEDGGNDGKGMPSWTARAMTCKGKGKEVHEADKAGGRGKAEGKGRDRSRSPRRHAA